MGVYLFDQYSLLHFSFGIFAYFFKFDLITFMVIHILFEIVENSGVGMSIINNYVKYIWPGGKNYRDEFINSMIGDNISAFCGWYLAYLVDKISDKYGLTPQ